MTEFVAEFVGEPPISIFENFRISNGKVGFGDCELSVITSRDPAPPPVEYVKSSGGYFRDSAIHDLDLAQWLMGEEIAEVSAFGANFFEEAIRQAGDFDTAATTLRSRKSTLRMFNNSRRAVCGFDRRIEVFWVKWQVADSEADGKRPLARLGEVTGRQDRLKRFFLERYEESFRIELDDFLQAVKEGCRPSVTGEDGRKALIRADAARQSAETGRAVRI